MNKINAFRYPIQRLLLIITILLSQSINSFSQEVFTEMISIDNLTGVYGSSVAWGDYDNDGDLDILLTGHDGTNTVSEIYKNNGDLSFTKQTEIELTNVGYGSVAWGDYDNDGYLDILLTGSDLSDNFSKIYKNNGGLTFTEEAEIELTGISSGSVAWGDYDNDGDLDILLTGHDSPTGPRVSISKIYKNNGGLTFDEQTSISLAAVGMSSVAWGDYDNDGDLDILLSGGEDDNENRISKIYKNNGNDTFSDINAGIEPVSSSFVAWGDYDNDGDLDILLTGGEGDYGNRFFKIYKNNGDDTFSEIDTGINPVSSSSVAWGDYDNDGDLDILLTGNDSSSKVTKIYKNNGDDTFSDIDAGIEGVGLGSAVWGDYDNDGDLDILLTGYDDLKNVTKIYSNNSTNANSAPQAPTNLTETINENQAILSWNAATDTETKDSTLTYNVFVRTATDTIVMPHVNTNNGFVKQPAMGNAQLDTSFTLKKLASDTYYWKVHAVDNCYAGGAFSEESSFIIRPFPPVANNDSICINSSVTLTATGENIKWYANNDYTGLLAEGESYIPTITEAGTYHFYVSQTVNGIESLPSDVTLTVYPLPTASFDSENNTVCEGTPIPVTLSGDAPWDISYSTNTQEEVSVLNISYNPFYFYPSIPGDTYTILSLIDGNGCEATDLGSSFQVYANASPEPNNIDSRDATLCLNTKNVIYTLQNQAENHSFFWEVTNGSIVSGQNTEEITVNWDIASGDALITVTEVNTETTCEHSFSQIYNISSNPAPDILDIIQKSETMLLSVDSGYAYQWYLNGDIIPNATKQYYYNENMPIGDYQVEVIDQNNCYNFSSTYTFGGVDKKRKLDETITVYPNPTTGNITINIENDFICDVKYTVSNNLGQKKKEDIICKEQKTIVLDKNLSDLPPGNYLIEFIFGSKEKVSKQLIIK